RDLPALDVGASVTGEGVETAAQLETLGVDQAQGYLLARPSTDIDTWEEWWTRGQDTDDIGTAFSPPLPGTGRQAPLGTAVPWCNRRRLLSGPAASAESAESPRIRPPPWGAGRVRDGP